MVKLYSLWLSSGRPGQMVCGPVKAIHANLAGHLNDNGELIRPDDSAVRQCLPHYYRKAFDRNKGRFWFGDKSKTCHMTLYGANGKYLNTLKALLYDFD